MREELGETERLAAIVRGLETLSTVEETAREELMRTGIVEMVVAGGEDEDEEDEYVGWVRMRTMRMRMKMRIRMRMSMNMSMVMRMRLSREE